MSPQPDAEITRAASIVHSTLGQWPADTFTARDQIPVPDPDPAPDYTVAREIVIEPRNANACPMELWFVGSGNDFPYIALGFDRWTRLATRVGAKSNNRRFVFGTEPMSITEAQLRAVIIAILHGELQATYTTVFRRILSANGHFLVDVGIPKLERSRRGSTFRYAAYAA